MYIWEHSSWVNSYNGIELEDILKQSFQFRYAGQKFSSPKEAALQVRNELKLNESEPILDICEILQRIGIRLILIPSPLKEFFGLSVKLSENNLAIGINKDESIPIERKIFTIAKANGWWACRTMSGKIEI